MASMNWLGFSLYPQELPHEEHSQTVATTASLGFNSDEGISATGECFDLTSQHSTAPHHSLNHLPPPFPIFDALNRNISQDWNTKDNYSNQSFLLGTSCSNNQQQQQQQPKLENFLGQHSFGDNSHQDHPTYGGNSASSRGGLMFPSCSLQLPAASQLLEEESAACGGSNGGSGSSKNTNSIGLSMIKSWLRNQPPQKQPSSSSSSDAAAAANISLSMSTVSQSTSSMALPLLIRGSVDGESSSSDNNKQQQQQQPTTTALEGQASAIVESAVPAARKAIDTFGQRTSIYRGVTRHRWTGRYEAHLWDNSCRREGQTRKGRQVYLGGYDKEEKAARAYDLAALKYWGTTTTTNFPISNYEKELEEMKHMTRQEYIASLRRKSSGFSRGASIYRGVTRHHQHGRWQARIGRVAGNKDLYLGTFSTQEEAAEAYDIAAIKFRGLNAVTNFEMSRYDVKSILESSTLPIGGVTAKRLKDNNVEQVELSVDNIRQQKSSSEDHSMNSHLSYGANNNQHGWPSLQFQQQSHQPYSQMHGNYHYGHHQKLWCKQEQDVVDASQTFHDIHMLQVGNTHNFFQSNSGVHSFMGIDSSSIDNNSSGSIYGDGNGYGGSSGGYMIPIGNDGGNQNQRSNNGFGDNDIKLLGYENVMNSSDPYYYHARNLYYHSQQTCEDHHAVKGSEFDACNTNWVPTAIPTTLAAPRPNNNMALSTGAPPFTLLHE